MIITNVSECPIQTWLQVIVRCGLHGVPVKPKVIEGDDEWPRLLAAGKQLLSQLSERDGWTSLDKYVLIRVDQEVYGDKQFTFRRKDEVSRTA